MADLIEFTYAKLSLAAYAKFNESASPIDALVTAGFSLAQAEQFVATYQILDHQPNTGSGFSATVFQRIGSDDPPILAIRGTRSSGVRSCIMHHQ
jgi:hypothetical protein